MKASTDGLESWGDSVFVQQWQSLMVGWIWCVLHSGAASRFGLEGVSILV
jgi:hypothetical protein